MEAATVHDSPGSWTPAQEAARAFDCQTPGCAGEASARKGRFAYCVPCQIRRGTRTKDGRLISGKIPTSPGSRFNPVRVRQYGPLEEKAMALVVAARHIDTVVKRQGELKTELLEAVAEWHEAIAQLPRLGRPEQ